MSEIKDREFELTAARDKLIEQEEENRTLAVKAEKLTTERDFLVADLRSS